MARKPTGRPMGRPRHPGLLTPAEQRVLDEVRLGLTNAEIAVRLGLSPDTVKTHVAAMLSKLGLEDRRALAAWREEPERRWGWFGLPGLGGWRRITSAAVGAATVLVLVTALLLVVAHRDGDSPSPGVTETPAPDGGTMLFVGGRPGERGSVVYSLDPITGASAPLAGVPGTEAFVPAWSPGAERFSFLTIPAGNALPREGGPDRGTIATPPGTLWVAEASGADLRSIQEKVALEPIAGGLPVSGWLANGTGVIYSDWDLWDGHGDQLLAAGHRPGVAAARDGPGMLGCPMGAQSPDGQYLVCAGIGGPTNHGSISVNRVDRDGTSGGHQAGTGTDPRQPSVSADGRWLAWWGTTDGTAYVYVAPMTGGDPVLTAPGLYPRWSPRGAQLVFVSGFPSAVAMLSPAAGPATLTAHDMSTGLSLTLASAGHPRWPAWSPAGDRVAFVADATDGKPEVFVVDASGGPLRQVTDNAIEESMLEWAPPPSTVEPEVEQRDASVQEVLASGQPVPYAVCLTGEDWRPLTPEQRRALLTGGALGDGRGGASPWARRLLRSRFHYAPQVAIRSDWIGIEELVLQYGLGDATRDVPSCDYAAVSTPPVVTRGVIVFDHRVVSMRRLGENLVVTVQPDDGHWEEAVVPYPADIAIPYLRYYFSVVAFVDESGQLLERRRADRGW